MDNYVGKRLDGRYEVQEIIGVGGMSVVYKAYDNVDDRIVAIKVLKEEFLNNEEFKRRFKNESKAIALLSHPNIVKVYDVNFGEKLQYIVMEYIDGITLKEYITKQGAITWNDALFFMSQILKAVQHAHDKGIVHRDIKPQNIILLQNGNIKVTDFGIARFSRSETKTLTEQAIGSVHYIAPEQAKGEYTDEKADIYSLGVVLYEMLAGSVPFEADSAVSVALMQLQADAERLTDINADIPLGLEQICIHAMEKNPIDRYQTATEILLDIEEVINNPSTTFDYTSTKDNAPTMIVDKDEIISSAGELDEEEELYDDYEDPDHKKKVVSAIVIGIIVLIAAVVLLVMGVTKGLNTSTTKLENFVGTSYDELVDSGQYNYKFVAEYEATNEAAPGVVIRQTPEAGTKVIEGSDVTLVVATSEDDISVPNVYGMTLERAQAALEKEGLTKYKSMTVASENVAEGQVVYTDPKASNIVSQDTEITIYVSSGPSTTVVETLKVPDISGLSKDGAKSFLEKYGFTNVSFVTQDSEKAKDVVISQSPAAGEQAEANTAFKIVVSSGVTTTTTKSVRTTIKIKLPKCINEKGNAVKDTLVVKIDGKTYSSQSIVLDGSSTGVSVNGDGIKSQKVTVSLKGRGASSTFTTKGDADDTKIVDFSSYSYNKETSQTTTEAPTESTTKPSTTSSTTSTTAATN